MRNFLVFTALLSIPAWAAPEIESISTFRSSYERMALQGITTANGVVLLGGYTYPERSCLREISLVRPDGTEETLRAKLAVGRNHFRVTQPMPGQILVIAGYSEDHGSLAEVELIDLEQGTVQAWPWLMNETELFSIAELPGKVAVIGGLIAQGMTQTWDAIQIIDLETKEVSFSSKPLATSRFGHESVWLPNLKKVLIVGGKNVSRGAPGPDGKRPTIWTPLSSMELWDPATGEVTPAGKMSVARDRPALHLLTDGKVLIVGGATEDPQPRKLSSIELYDPETQETRVIGEMKVGRMAATLLPYRAEGLLIAGGWVDDPEAGRLIEYFDFSSSSSVALANAASSRAEHVMTWLGEKEFLLVGGKNSFGSANPHASHFMTTEIVHLR